MTTLFKEYKEYEDRKPYVVHPWALMVFNPRVYSTTAHIGYFVHEHKWHSNRRISRVVVLAQPLESKGPSVTNVFEQAATHFFVKLSGLEMKEVTTITWIEHYDYVAENGGTRRPFMRKEDEESFAMVTLRWNHVGKGFLEPQWRHVTREAIESFYGFKVPTIDGREIEGR